MGAAAGVGCVRVFGCGPVVVELLTPDEEWASYLEGELGMFDAAWDGERLKMGMRVVEGSGVRKREVIGNYLRCDRYVVDRVAGELIAESTSGARLVLNEQSGQAVVEVPGEVSENMREDVEQLSLLLLVWGWRKKGWTPLHVGSVVKGDCCGLVCAAAGGGKSTFTGAMIRRGWGTLGDDKLLASAGAEGRVHVRGLSRGMNLDPAVGRWFPEAQSLAELPRYSRWNQKRKVAIESIWSGRVVESARPTHLLKLERGGMGIAVEKMEAGETLETLARQVAIPQDRQAAAMVMRTIVAMSGRMCGLRVRLGADVYERGDTLELLERALGVSDE